MKGLIEVRKMRGILCFVLAFTMIFAQSIATFAVDFSDVPDNSPYKDAIYTLADFKILLGDGGTDTFRPEANISREEFSVIMIRVLGLGDLNVNVTEYPFTDVTPDTCDDWSIKATKLAYDLGIIKGMGDGTFAPKDPVTYEQAVKMIVCALGYEAPAIEAGGWPNGYMQIARSKGITQKAEMTQTDPAPRGVIAQLVYNSLEVDLMTQVASSGDEPKYVVNPGQNILTNNLKYTKGTGVITGIKDTALTNSGSSIKEDEVEIDSQDVYKVGETDALSYLGKQVNYYYRVTDEQDKELVMARMTDKNWELNIPAENISEITSNQIEYWEDTSDTSVVEILDFDSDVKAIYNGKFVSDVDADITPDTGNVLTIDNDGDGDIDVLIVDASEVIVVDAIDSENYTIYDKYDQSKTVVLDPKSKDTINITKNGSSASFGTIMKDDVLLVSESKNTTGSKIINVEIISNKVTGVVTEISLDNTTISINDREYRCSRTYQNYIDSNPKEQVNVDDNITAYLDQDGKILAVSISAATGGRYGYLANAGVDEDNEVAQFRIYTMDNKVMTYDGVSKVKINGESFNYDEVLDKLSSTNSMTNKDPEAENDNYAQLIEYTLSGNKISAINTIKSSGDIDKNLVISERYNETPVKYRSSTKTLGNVTSLSSTTKVFYVPSDRTDYTAYSVSNYSSLQDGIEYSFEAYDCTDTKVAGVIVIYGEAGTISVDNASAPIAIVDSISSVQDDGQPVHRLTAYINNEVQSINAIDTDVLRNFRKGDVIKYSVNNEGKISDAKLVFRATNPPQTDSTRYVTDGKDADTPEAEYLTVYGTVYGRDDERMTVSLKDIDSNGNLDGSELYTIPFSDDVAFYVVDISGSNLRFDTGMINDIAGYTSSKTGASQIFAYAQYGETKFVIIVKS